MTRRSTLTPFSEIEAKPPPVCDACGESMWWHGGTEGWGCRYCREGLEADVEAAS